MTAKILREPALGPGPSAGAHPYYRDLVRTYDDDGYNMAVHRITQRQFNLAANALADLISSLR